VRLGGVVDKPTAWKQRGRPQLLAVEDPQVCAPYALSFLNPLHRACCYWHSLAGCKLAVSGFIMLCGSFQTVATVHRSVEACSLMV